MAHRGRLNVLAHVLGKPYAQILAEFKDPVMARTGYRIDLGWTGDVKYHAGALRQFDADTQVSMAPNPSHLEFVNPVIEGSTRARLDRRGDALGESWAHPFYWAPFVMIGAAN